MNERSKQVRRDVIKLMHEHNLQHYGGSMSCIEIMIALFDYVMKPNDIFLLSKGHCCGPLYVLLREKGLNPIISHHPKYDPANGINMTSGSLGHGLGFGIGIALSKKIKNEQGRIFVLMGDGELAEGTLWESLLIHDKLELDNLTVIIDHNLLQGSDRTYNILRINEDVITSAHIDGHNIDTLVMALSTYHLRDKYPDNYTQYIFAETYKGKGVSFMSDKSEWHSKVLSPAEYEQALKELE
jgi:transketolase